jgi:hypothetical protein
MAIESHINTFQNGMTKDYSILYQPDGTYRHCVNCSLISQDGNNYVIKDCLGNVRTFVINRRYGEDETSFDTAPYPIGFISFPDKLIVFSTNNATENGGYGEIGTIAYEPYGEGVQPVIVSGNANNGYIPLYHHSSLNFTILQQIEGFAFQENELIKRVYWTDDFNEPRVIDIGNPIFTTYIASGSLVTGQQYMVLEGVIDHNGTDYGPTVGGGSISGNIFTAANANYTSVTGTSPTPRVIQYFPYQLLNFTPSRSLGSIKFVGYGTGNKYCGNKMYFYRLLSSTDGIQTSWSYGTFPVPVRLGGVGAYFTDLGGGTPTNLVNSGKSVLLQITDIDTNFERIQIAVAEFDQLWEVPRVIGIVIDEPITGSTMDFEDDSSGNIGTLTLSDLTLFPASILRCKTMTTNKNYNLIGNIQERGEIEFDKTGVTIEEFDHPIPAHRDADGGTAFSCPNVQTYVPLDYDPFNNPSGANAIMPYTTWVVLDDSGGPVVYNGTNYNEGEVFTGVPTVFTVTIPVGSLVRACVFKNKYTTSGGAPRPDASLLTSGYWDFKDPTVANNMKGYWDTEKYRLGILFFDLKGNPFYVRHLIDIDTTRDYSNDPLTFDESDNDSPVMYINQKLFRLSGITLTPELVAKISGFSIVRVERDARIMTQGFLMQSSLSAAAIPPYTVIQPACSYQLNLDALTGGGSVAGYYSFLCPDSLVSFPIPNYADGINMNGTSIEEAYWVRPRDQSGNLSGVYLKSVTGLSNEFETKYFETLNGDSDSPRTEPIRSQFNVVENGNLASFGNQGIYYQNRSVVGLAGLNVDNECFTGIPNSTNTQPANSVGIGGPRTVLELSSDTMTDRGAVTLYSAFSTSGRDKMMVNIVVPKDNPYGGNSDAALAANTYISIGHFQPINPTVLGEVISGGNYVFNDVEVAGGDCFAILCDYGYGLYDDTEIASYSWGIKFPCQCNTNYGLRNGVPSRKVAPDLMHSNAAGNGIFFRVGADVQLEQFQYNQGYSSEGDFLAYPALPLNFSANDIFRYRIRFGGQKFPGEIINTFRTFLINDYKDTDGQGGEINNLRTKDGKTVVFQNAIISTVPILERQLISGLDGAETTLGTGGVVDRFDPINSYFGNQHQWGLTSTEFGFVWFDMRRKAVVALDFGNGIGEISMVEGLKGFFDEIFVEVVGNTSPINNDILNDPTFSKYSDRPLTGVGICGVYDPKFKMTYLTFKFISRTTTVFLNKDFTIGYYHPNKQFIGFFDWTPGISWNHNQIVLSANNPKNKLKYFAAGMASTSFVVGDVVPYLGVEYICISDVTIASYPGTITTTPGVPGSTFWRQINTTNELWVHNQPKELGQQPAPDYLYDSFFGQVVNNELQYVVNPKTANPFSVLNMEQEGNTVNFTDLTISAESQSATDTSISPTSRFYRVIYDKICNSMPLSSTGRITNSYLLVRWVKKNWSTDPTVVSKAVKVLRFIKSMFEQKR